jgi:hypothetical protein
VAGASSQHLDGGVGNVGDLAIYRGRAWETVLLLVMLELQLLRRLHESINLFQYSPLARMHIVGYLIGMGYFNPNFSSYHFFIDSPNLRCYLSMSVYIQPLNVHKLCRNYNISWSLNA